MCVQVPSSEDAVTPSSAVTPSASGASSRPFIPVTDDPGAASIIAETMTKTKEARLYFLLHYCFSVRCINARRACLFVNCKCVFGEHQPRGRNSAILLFYIPFQDSESQSKVVGLEPQYLDEFTSLLVPDDTRVMVDLLKLAVSCRSGEKGREVLSAVLSGMGTAYPQVTFRTLFASPCECLGLLLTGCQWSVLHVLCSLWCSGC